MKAARELCFAVAVFVLAGGAAQAHDFWVQPTTYEPAVPSVLGIGLRVGERFGAGDPYARNPAHVLSFVIVGPAGMQPVGGQVGAEPAGVVAIEAPGTYVIGYRSAQTVVELEASVFEHYLMAEHLEQISRLRAGRGESAAPGREAFSRCAKAIVVAGTPGEAGYDRLLGFTLELVPERPPAVLEPGAELPVRLLYEGAPLANAYVAAISVADPGTRIERRTDAQGRVRLRLDRDGVWLVRSLHVRAAPPGLGVDWESVWASLTFVVKPPRW